MIRTLLTILIITFFITPVHAGEVDGKGLECTRGDEQIYYRFSEGRVFLLQVIDKTPLRISENDLGLYYASVEKIWWTDQLTMHTELYRKSLKLDYGNSGLINYICQVRTPEEIETALQKEIDALKEKMKDNKI